MRSLIGNKSSEKDIRDWLSSNGYSGKLAKFAEVELHAIMRPGWLQIFRFAVATLTAEDQKTQLYGAIGRRVKKVSRLIRATNRIAFDLDQDLISAELRRWRLPDHHWRRGIDRKRAFGASPNAGSL